MVKIASLSLLLFLGTLLSFGPFITDMYLVALPKMAEYFNTGIKEIQLTLTFSLFGLASGQLVFGYLSDTYGQKYPLIFSLFFFNLFTLLCFFIQNLNIFIIYRFFQGFFGAGCIVLARSILPNLFSKENLVKAVGLTTFIYTFNRIISPLIGGITFNLYGWKGIFLCLLLIGGILLIYTFDIRENVCTTILSKKPLKIRIKNLIQNKTFVCFSASFTFILTMQFSYIASSSFIFQKFYLIKPLTYSVLFSINAAFFGLGSIIPLKKKISLKNSINISIGLIIICTILTLTPILKTDVYIYELLLIVFRILTGLCFTVFMATALDSCRENSGLGAAFLGTFYFLLGGLITPLVGYGNIFYSSGSIMLIFAILNLISLTIFYCKYKGQ